MAGIYGVVAKKELPEVRQVYRHFFSASLSGVVNEEHVYDRMVFGRSVLPRFRQDRIIWETDALIVVFEGVCYNLDQSFENTGEMIASLFRRYAKDFVLHLDGNFSGFVFDKKTRRLHLFTDHLNTKPLYIYHDDDYFIFGSELKVVSAVMGVIGSDREPDTSGIYSLMAFGYILNNATLIRNVTKMHYGTVMTLYPDTMYADTHRYFDFSDIKEDRTLSEDRILELIDEKVMQSVERQWEKDRQYGYRHYAFLSGGLDSRVNTLLAWHMGYKDITAMTFSQSESNDHIISERIAKRYGLNYEFMQLDNGAFLEREEELIRYVAANDGMNLLIGSAAGFHFLSVNPHEGFGTLHTGQIGDLLFGSYAKPHFSLPQAAITRDENLFEKIVWFGELRERYEDRAELFGYEQRVMHGTFNGDRMLSHLADISSPFYNRDLITFCLSLPKEVKVHEAIYLKWFNAFHPYLAEFPWEQAGVRPTSVLKTVWGRKWLRYRNALRRRMGGRINDMNPYDRWLRQNEALRSTMENIYSERIGSVADTELRRDLKAMFEVPVQHSHYGRYNKFVVVTVLLALSLHFSKEEK